MPRGVSPVDDARLQQRLWTPGVLVGSSLRLWLDAGDLATISSPSGISQWRDKSGKENHATPPGEAFRPSWVASQFNGGPCVRFTRNNGLTTISNIGISGNQDRGLFVVSRRRTSLANDGFMAHWGNATTRRAFGIDVRTSVFWYYWLDDIQSSTYGAANTIHAWGFTHTDGVGRAYATDSFVASRTVAADTVNTPVQVGWRDGAYADVDIAEIMIVSGVVSDRLRNLVNGYFAWKWSLVDKLPASHPFRNRPPLIGD